MGYFRSGTTWLYDCLVRAGSFNYLSVYHRLCYDRLLRHRVEGTEALARGEVEACLEGLGIRDREVDGVEVGPDAPEEYGELIMYRLRELHLTRHTREALSTLVRKLSYLGAADRPLLLKNPPDFANFHALRALFPNARFVFIHRHPMETLSSLVRAVRQVSVAVHPYLSLASELYRRNYGRRWVRRAVVGVGLGPLDPLGYYLLWRLYREVRGYLRAIGSLPGEVYVDVTYDELCRSPEATIDRVLAFLGQERRGGVELRSRRREQRPDPRAQQTRWLAERLFRGYVERFSLRGPP